MVQLRRATAAAVIVQPPCGAGIKDGGGIRRSPASPTATRKSSNGRPCCRQVATAVNSRSAKRLPASLSEAKLPLRHSTTGRRARSDTLFVGVHPLPTATGRNAYSFTSPT